MKSTVFCVLLVLCVAFADQTWESFKAKHGKKYNAAEEVKRKGIFAKANAKIQAHNKRRAQGQEKYSLTHNEFSDMLPEEKALRLGRSLRGNWGDRDATFHFNAVDRDLPESYDLRESTCMPAVKQQGGCGSCWAFASVTPIEYQYCLKRNNNVSVTLSEQQVTDCTYTTDGCQGGAAQSAWSKIYSSGGLQSASSYPFVSGTTGKSTKCTFSATKAVAKLSKAGTTIAQDEVAIQTALVANGPITFAFHVTENFYSYDTGVYTDSTCSKDMNSLNHEMVLVGYGVSEDDTPYWIVRNTWSDGWGQGGYAFVQRDTNECGTAMDAGFPTVA